MHKESLHKDKVSPHAIVSKAVQPKTHQSLPFHPHTNHLDYYLIFIVKQCMRQQVPEVEIIHPAPLPHQVLLPITQSQMENP